FHFIGSLVPSQHPDLLRIPAAQFIPFQGERLAGVSACRRQKKIFGEERTVLVTFNEALLQGQMQGITANLDKARRKLDELQASLRRRREGRVKGGRAPSLAGVRKQ